MLMLNLQVSNTGIFSRGEKKRCKDVDLFTGREAEHGQRAGVTLSSLCGAASAGALRYDRHQICRQRSQLRAAQHHERRDYSHSLSNGFSAIKDRPRTNEPGPVFVTITLRLSCSHTRDAQWIHSACLVNVWDWFRSYF